MRLRLPRLHLDPVTRKRFQRFRALRRAWWSFLILAALFLLSLAAELVASGKPIVVRHRGEWFFPIFRHYSERAILGAGGEEPANYRRIADSDAFRNVPGSWALFPPVPYGPTDIIDASALPIRPEVAVTIAPEPAVAELRVDADLRIVRTLGWSSFGSPGPLRLADAITVPAGLGEAVSTRLANRPAAAASFDAQRTGGGAITLELPAYRPRTAPPAACALVVREKAAGDARPVTLLFNPDGTLAGGDRGYYESRPAPIRAALDELVARRVRDVAEPAIFEDAGVRWRASATREDARFPFRPCEGHPFGLDSSGRDVFSRVLYGTRISLLFGIGLVLVSTVTGTIIGGLQGFFGGRTDLFGQRLTEIWGAMPFLYLMILAGDVFGRSIMVLFICYALFYWIGISLYMRAEFLRLRRLPYVDAARGLGLGSWTIMMRHILPNALVPIITFFPFSLVGAIGVLTSLDFLGFGLPPPTPSWGELLSQAHEVKWAWWLVLYPSLALFIVMLLGVFIGEGLRAAFDPKKFARME